MSSELWTIWTVHLKKLNFSKNFRRTLGIQKMGLIQKLLRKMFNYRLKLFETQ